MNAIEIGYALAKQVPAMRQEVRLYTDCGEILLGGAAAERVASFMRSLRAAIARAARAMSDLQPAVVRGRFSR